MHFDNQYSSAKTRCALLTKSSGMSIISHFPELLIGGSETFKLIEIVSEK